MQAAAVTSSLGLRRLSAETRLTLLLFAFSFFISGVPRVYTQTAAHTLFLNAYGSAAMPYAYLAEALCVPLAGWLYMLAERRTSFRRLVIGTLGVDILVQVGFRLAIWLQLPFAAAGTIVWFEVEFVLSSLLLWGLANSLMTLRQGKRLFGFVSAGEPVAVIVCGITTPMLMDWLQPADLFLFSALGAAIGMLLVLVITARFQPVEAAAPDRAESTDDNGKQSATPRPWWKNRFIVTMVAVVFVSQLGYFFVDNAFYMEASGRYPAESDLASFLGLYSAVMGVISLICSVGLAGPLVSRFGVRGGLLTLPLLLTVGALAAVVCGHLGGGLNAIFWLVVLNKVIDQAFRYTLDKTNSVTLYQPLPSRQRTQVQAGLESMVEPLSGGVAGLALYALLNWFGFTAFHVTHVIAIVAGLWTVGVFVQHRGYLGALRQALAGRRLQDAALLLDDVEAVNCLRQGLASPHAGAALYSLELLDGTDWRPTAEEVAALLVHPAPEVRLDVARRIERGRLSLAIDQITARLSVEAAPEVRGALIEALSAAPLPDPIGSLAPYLDDPDPAARLGACSGLIRHGGIEGVMEVGGRLIAAQSDTDPAARQFVARVIERVGSPQLYRPLLALLADPDPAVRGSALHAVCRVGTPRVWPAVFDNLGLATTRQRAIAALVAIGEPVLEEATARFAQPAATYPLRRDLIAVCGRIGSPAAFDWLLRLVEHPDRRLKGGCPERPVALPAQGVQPIPSDAAPRAAWRSGRS